MKIITEIELRQFDAWSGAKDTQETIINSGNSENFDNLVSELYPEGIADTDLNDLLWFESDWLYKQLGIDSDEEEQP